MSYFTFFKKNIELFFIAAMVVLTTLASSYPILLAKQASAFYTIDPEMAYVSNALSFTKDRIITYADHPGTPTVLMLAGSYVPLRLLAKYVDHTPFVLWSFDNIRILFYYTRVVMVLLFAISVFVYLYSVFKATRSKSASILALFTLGLFPFFFNIAGKVVAESLSFFIISIWLFVFVDFSKYRSPIRLIALSLISGFAMANKLNNVVIALASLLLVLSIKSLNLKQKFYNIILNIISIIFGFVIGTWHIRGSYTRIILEIIKVAGSSGPGAAHGGGLGGILNINFYLQSVMGFWITERFASIAFLTILFVFGFLIVKKKITIFSPAALVFLSSMISGFFILKYSSSYYQFPNYIVLVFIGSVFIAKLFNKRIILIMILLAPVLFVSWKNHFASLKRSISSSEVVAQFEKDNPAKKAALYDYAPVDDFMYIWMRGWGSGIFDQELKIKRPDILELKSDYKTVYLDYSNHKDVFEACWDKLYIRENRAKVFLNMYQDKKLTYIPIDDTGIWAISSNHCFTTKPETF